MELFRKEVAEARRDVWLGTVDVSMSTLSWTLPLLVAGFMVVAAGFFALGTYSRSERAIGQLRPSLGLIPVVAPQSGTLLRTMVREGQPVSAGQPLFEVSAERSSSASTPEGLGATLKKQLTEQQRLLEDDLIWVNSKQLSMDSRVKEEIKYLRRRLALAEEQQALKRQEADSSQKMLERVRRLDSGMITALQLQQYESSALNALGEVKRLTQQRMEVQRDLDSALRQRNAAPVDIIERRNGIERALSDVAQLLARNEVQTTQIVRAPVDGVVSVMLAHPGQPVTQGLRVLTVIPKGSVLEAELWVPSQAVGILSVGGRVALRYHAFPYRQFGHRYGNIISISASALTPEEVKSSSGIQTEALSFRILVALDEQHVPAAGVRHALRPSMTLDADLLLERQPLYRLLLPASTSRPEPRAVARAPQ